MPTPVWQDGGEHQTLSTNKFGGAADTGLYQTVTNPGNITFVDGYDGGKAFRFTCSASTALLDMRPAGSTNYSIVSFYIRVVSLPTVASLIIGDCGHAASGMGLFLGNDGILQVNIGGGAKAGSTNINDGNWHRIDYVIDADTNPWTLTWKIDGNDQTAPASSAQAAASGTTQFRLGGNTSGTYTLEFDHVVISKTFADYPLGAHRVSQLVPDADDTTLSVYGTNQMEQGTATDLSSSNQGWQYLDDWPGTNADAENDADHVTQSATGATNQVTVDFPNISDPGVFWGTWMLVGMKADGTQACNGTTRARFSDATTLNVYSGDPSETSAHYRQVQLTQSKVDAISEFNGLKAQVGLSSDGAPEPEWVNLMVAYVIPGTDVFTTTLVINDALHSHTADNLALTQHNILAINDALHSHAADNVALVMNLIIQDSLHGHTADTLGLTQHNILAIQDALHGHTTDGVALTQHNVLAIQDALHGHAADTFALTQHHILAIADALHGHAADNIVLTAHDPGGPVALVIQDATHSHTADGLVLGVGLVIGDARHTHTTDGVALTQHNVLAIHDALHSMTADQVVLFIPGSGSDEQHVIRFKHRRRHVGKH